MNTRKKVARDNWEESYEKTTERDAEFSTTSGIPVKPLYTEEDVEGSPDERLGYPVEYPYTRGVYPNMYRGGLWTVRQFAGYGDAEDTNKRFKYPIDHGQNGLSVAFDMPTLMSLDSDSPLSQRVWDGGRGDRFAGGHGVPLRRHPAGQDHDLNTVMAS